MADEDRGQVDTHAAEVYDSLFVPALFGRFAEAIADAAQIERTDHVLDVACGSGALTRTVRSRTTGRVVGIDPNSGMLEVARRHGGDIEYAEGDGQDLPFAAGEFDVATCQFGLMFYPDPARGNSELARVSRRGAVAVWDAIESSEGYIAMQELFRDILGPHAAKSLDAPFAMGKTGALETLFTDAEIEEVSYLSIAGTGRFDSIEQWVTTEVRGWTLSDSVTEQQLANSSTWLGTGSAPSRPLTGASSEWPPKSPPGSSAEPRLTVARALDENGGVTFRCSRALPPPGGRRAGRGCEPREPWWFDAI